MFAEIKPFLNWLHAHPDWAGFVVFLISFCESLALVGLLIPGSVIMTAIGALVATGHMPFWPTVFWAAAGAILGDVLSFWVGYYFKDGVRKIWPIRLFPKLLEKGEDFFKMHGGKSVFLGRFVGPVRPILPLIAGMLSMSPVRFLIVDIISGIVWPPVYMLPGLLVGTAALSLPPEAATRLIVFVVLIVLVLSCVSWLLKRGYHWLEANINKFFSWGWSALSTSPPYAKVYNFMLDPVKPADSTQLKRSFLFLLMSVLFLVLAANVYTHGILIFFNQPFYHFMRGLRIEMMDHFFVGVTLLSAKILTPMWLALFVFFIWKKYWRAAWHWLAVGLLTMGLTEIFKFLVHSPRPFGLLETPAGWSFPSGHTSVSITFFGFLAILLCREKSKATRCVAYSIAAFICFFIIASRLYLTAHWLTDIIGGILLAGISISLLSFSYHRKATPKIPALPTLIIAFVVLVLTWGVVAHKHYQQALHNYSPYWQVRTLDVDNWWKQPDKQLPLYRTNRFGKPIEVLNLQWNGSLFNIQQELTAHGWSKVPKASLLLAVSGFTNKNFQHQPFVVSQLYDDRKAVLQMTKVVNTTGAQGQSAVLVLRLWNANMIFSNGQPLWLGVVDYHMPWHVHFLKSNGNGNGYSDHLPIPTEILVADLQNFNWRKITYDVMPVLPLAIPKNGNILLIMPKNK